MADTDTLSSDQVIALAKKYVIGNYTRYPVCLVRGEGSWVWDAEGNRYLDFFPGWGCGILGHCPPRVVEAEKCAILLEPIQGEGGINLPPAGFLEGLRELCDAHGLLLILDEVQTGMGRTGKWYAHQHWGVRPDICTLAKALAGGVAMGGLIATPAVAEKLKPGTHAATFGGNPLACAAALATFETIETDGLLDRAVQVGERFRAHFLNLKERCPLIQDV